MGGGFLQCLVLFLEKAVVKSHRLRSRVKQEPDQGPIGSSNLGAGRQKQNHHLAVEGEVEFEISGVTSRPEIGEEIFIPAGAVHSVRNIGNKTSKWLYGYRKK